MSGPLEIHEIPVRDSGRDANRAARLHLRQGLRDFTRVRRVAWCGRISPRFEGARVRTPEIRLARDGAAYVAGVATCGSVWCCPVCSARKRTERALEAAGRFGAWQRSGGSLVLLTLTLPHGIGDRCAELMSVLKLGWRAVFSGRPYRQDREDFGIHHWFRGWDATYGRHGWHPHLHAVLLLNQGLDPEARAALERRISTRWIRAIRDAGHRPPNDRNGAVLTSGESPLALARYLAKAPDLMGVALEVAAPHLKSSNAMGPFTILDRAVKGDARARRLWHEWEQATMGQHFTQWSRGAKGALDDLCAEAEIGEDEAARVVHRFTADEWFWVRDCPALLADLLSAAEGPGAGVAVRAAISRSRSITFTHKWRPPG